MEKEELVSMGPWHKFAKPQYKQAPNKLKPLKPAVHHKESSTSSIQYLSEESTEILLGILFKYKIKAERQVFFRQQSQRHSLFEKKSWPSWELIVDELHPDTISEFDIIDERALAAVGLTPASWQACMNVYFINPSKKNGKSQRANDDQSICKLYASAMHTEKTTGIPWDKLELEKMIKAAGWRWLMLREAELEDQMEEILFKGDLELYHRVKAYELGKIED
jgi:hypothetical protein